MKLKLAVIGETIYADRLTECIQKHAPEYLKVSNCKPANGLTEFLEKLQPDILLYEQNAASPEALPENTVNILLTPEKVSDTSNHPVIFQYQQGSEILRQAFQIYAKSDKKNLICWCNTQKLEMTAFFAPGGYEYQLPFSISYASSHGGHNKVLYLNLAEFTGMISLLQDTEGEDFSDLIYGIRQKKERFALCLQSVLHHTDNFDYIQPPANPQDLHDIKKEDLTCLLSLLQEQTEYTLLVWNCGTWNQAIEQIMMNCSRVFCFVKESTFGKYRKKEFQHFLEKEIRKSLKDKIRYVNPQTVNNSFTSGADLLSQIQCGEFADQVQILTSPDTQPEQ